MAHGSAVRSNRRILRRCIRATSLRIRRCRGVHRANSIATRSSSCKPSGNSASDLVLVPAIRFRMACSVVTGRHAGFACWHVAVPRLKIPFRDRRSVAVTATVASRGGRVRKRENYVNTGFRISVADRKTRSLCQFFEFHTEGRRDGLDGGKARGRDPAREDAVQGGR